MIELKITRGKQPRPQKVVIYGPEGIGKTTLAAQFPDPLFIDTEGGSSHLDVARTQRPADWSELLELIAQVAAARPCKTLVVDTADWAEQLCVAHLLKKYRQTSIEGFGYGKGYTYLAEEMGGFLKALNDVIEAGIHVVLTAHAKMRKQELPDEAGAFDRWELKLSRQAAPLVKEWADLLLFINYKTILVAGENGHNKAQGGTRVIYTTHAPTYDAKNRHGLPAELPLVWDSIARIFEPDSPAARLHELMDRDGITEQQLRGAIESSKSYDPMAPIDSYAEKLVGKWEAIKSSIN